MDVTYSQSINLVHFSQSWQSVLCSSTYSTISSSPIGSSPVSAFLGALKQVPGSGVIIDNGKTVQVLNAMKEVSALAGQQKMPEDDGEE